jgi:hypothetical protein
MKFKPLVLWIVYSAIAAWLALIGLSLLLTGDQQNQLRLISSLILCVVLWLSLVTLLVTILVCAALVIFPNKKPKDKEGQPQSPLDLSRTEQASNERSMVNHKF